MDVATTARVAAAALLGTIAGVVPATSAQASPVSSGCPAAYDLIGIYSLGPGYTMPGKMDGVFGSYGLAPNDNSMVCALALGNATTPSGGQLYNFLDDSLPASR